MHLLACSQDLYRKPEEIIQRQQANQQRMQEHAVGIHLGLYDSKMFQEAWASAPSQSVALNVTAVQ